MVCALVNLGWYKKVVFVLWDGEMYRRLKVLLDTHDVVVPVLDRVFLGLTRVV